MLENPDKAIADAWANIRNAGGSIIGPDGKNLTADSEDDGDLYDAIVDGDTDDDGIEFIVGMINEAAADGAKMAEMNAIPTTKPKCYSKPIVQLKGKGMCTYHFVGRSGAEVDCSG